MYYSVFEMVHIKDPLLLIRKNNPSNGSSRLSTKVVVVFVYFILNMCVFYDISILVLLFYYDYTTTLVNNASYTSSTVLL